MIGIYKITNKINNHFYIGKSNNIKRRFIEHKCINHETNPSLKLAYKKYGLKNFSFEILEECKLEELNDKEIYYISKLNPEYNRTLGGDGASGHHLSKELKEVLRQKGKEQWKKMTKEQQEKIIKNNLIGPKNKYVVSEETKEKLRQANIGKKQSKETIEKRVKKLKAIIKDKKEKGIYSNGYHKKPIYCVETGEQFNSLKEAKDKYNLNTLCGHLKGRYKTCKGKHYKYGSVTTIPDEFKEVGEKMSSSSKCVATEKKVEEIV